MFCFYRKAKNLWNGLFTGHPNTQKLFPRASLAEMKNVCPRCHCTEETWGIAEGHHRSTIKLMADVHAKHKVQTDHFKVTLLFYFSLIPEPKSNTFCSNLQGVLQSLFKLFRVLSFLDSWWLKSSLRSWGKSRNGSSWPAGLGKSDGHHHESGFKP